MSPVESSSARRPARPSSQTLTIVIGLVVAAVGLIHLLQPAEELPPQPVFPSPVPSPSPSPIVVAPTPTPTPTPEPTTGPDPSPTPTPFPTLIPIAIRRPRGPTPTPGLDRCLPFRWTLSGATPTLNQIFVQIDATNRCGRKLGSDDIWFEVSGIRDGSVHHRVRAHPFEEVWPGRTVRISVGLQGSVDWYDEVRVVLLK